MERTVFKLAKPSFWALVHRFIDFRESGQVGIMSDKLMQGLFGPGGLGESNMKRIFIEYHERLRKTVPPERLVEFKVQDGYKPLCDSLGVPVPTHVVGGKAVEESFPRVNEGAAFEDRLVVLQRLQNGRLLKKAGTLVSAVALVGAVWYLADERGWKI